MKRKAKEADSEDENVSLENQLKHDCGGAIHIKFSAKRDAINIVYKHSPIHGTPEADQERYVVKSQHFHTKSCRERLVTVDFQGFLLLLLHASTAYQLSQPLAGTGS